ncbi:MAG: DUF4810 domain-containing protein [Gammaproteobacteria bacterium]|nr:MAG: DUF4810 domain-containing protein [Gammaproteobacteria bacterium]PHR85200.1 MAG: DUF4810 domain-containing protein [Colwellia sp.]
MKLVLTLLLFTAILSGCNTTPPPMYMYENYSESFYNLKKVSGDESDAQWQSSLESIIKKSNAKAVRVPPGIYANLGYIQLKANHYSKAIEFFEQEKSTYPESSRFMENLIQKAKAKG